MKSGWNLTTLGAVCQLQSGAGFPTKYQGHSEGQYPYFKVSDMNLSGNEDALIRANNYVSEDVRSTLGARVFPEGSVLFPKVGGAIATNKKRQAVQPSCVDNNIMGLIPNLELIDSDFLFEWMKGLDLFELSNKANPPSITQRNVASWPIVLPPLEEQKRIVALLHQAFSALDRAHENAAQNLADQSALVQGTLRSFFVPSPAAPGWRSAKLGELFSIGSSRRVMQSDWRTSGVPFYRAREIVRLAQDGTVENTLFISEQHFQSLALDANLPEPGDLMVSAVGTLGACYLVQTGDRFYYKDASVLCFKPKGGVDPQFMRYIFRWDNFLRKVGAGEGATVGTFTITRARATEVMLPSLEEQRSIAALLDQFFLIEKEIIAQMQRKLDDIAALRQSLLEAALSGQLS